jgi:hypothetical protein
MNGVVSIISGRSVGSFFMADASMVERGSITLAYLMEFSHFVDLYVLEDRVYFSDFDRSMYLYPMEDFPDSPILTLPNVGEQLDGAIFGVSGSSRNLLNETHGVFSTRLYDYWLRLSPKEREAVPNVSRRRNKKSLTNQDYQLITSRAVQFFVERTLEWLGKTTLTIIPSPLTLLPFLDVFHQMDTPAFAIYNKVAAEHRKSVEDIIALIRPRTIYLPPLLSILFSRCETREEIPYRLHELRDEFTDFRKAVKKWFNQLDQAASLREKIEIRNELDEAINGLIKLYEYKRKGFYKQVAGAFISAVEEGDVKKMILKPTFAVLKEGVTAILPEMISVRRFTGMIDLMEQALNVENYSNLLNKLFGEYLNISQREITEAKRYHHFLQSKYDLGLQFPS